MTKKQKAVLLIISKMGVGGAQQIVLHLANRLVRSGYEVSLLLFFRVPQDRENLSNLDAAVKIVYMGRPIFLSEKGAFWQKVWKFFRMPWDACQWVRQGYLGDYQIVHTHLFLATWAGVWLLFCQRWWTRRRVTKHVTTFHTALNILHFLERAIFKVLWRFVDVLVLETVKADVLFLRHYLPNTRVEYIGYGATFPPSAVSGAMQACQKKYGLEREQMVVLSVSRLNIIEKKVDKLLRVISLVRRFSRQSFKYLLVGEGKDRAFLQDLTYSLGINDVVVFAGYIPLSRLWGCYGIARVFLTVEGEDLIGLAGLHAASMGVPIVSYQTQPSWQAGQNDRIWNSRDLVEIAKRIVSLMEDANLWQAESKRARRVFEQCYSVDGMVKSYMQLYDSLQVDEASDASR